MPSIWKGVYHFEYGFVNGFTWQMFVVAMMSIPSVQKYTHFGLINQQFKSITVDDNCSIAAMLCMGIYMCVGVL